MHDFTTVLGERNTPQTVGFIVELSGIPGAFTREDSTDRSTKYFAGPNSRITAQRLFDALGAANNEYKHPMKSGETRLQTIRVIEPGVHGISSMEGREDKVGLGQVKVPVVLSHVESREWILERVT